MNCTLCENEKLCGYYFDAIRQGADPSKYSCQDYTPKDGSRTNVNEQEDDYSCVEYASTRNSNERFDFIGNAQQDRSEDYDKSEQDCIENT